MNSTALFLESDDDDSVNSVSRDVEMYAPVTPATNLVSSTSTNSSADSSERRIVPMSMSTSMSTPTLLSTAYGVGVDVPITRED
eukprot:11720780-Ditylum_brightwellii.AAC.1